MRRCNGFTLLELLVVLAIIALVVGVTLPNLSLPRFATNATRVARQMASGLADARQQAIYGNRESVFVLDLEQHKYRVGVAPAIRLTGIKDITLLTTERDVVNASRGSIRFYPDGSSDGGEVSVRDAGGATATVRINWLTGRISFND